MSILYENCTYKTFKMNFEEIQKNYRMIFFIQNQKYRKISRNIEFFYMSIFVIEKIQKKYRIFFFYRKNIENFYIDFSIYRKKYRNFLY